MHHALLLVGEYTWALDVLPDELRTPQPDVVHLTGDRMGIDDVRTLTYEAYLTPLTNTERVFIIAYGDITREAQNALLKLLEEPPATARFYLITPRVETLLPTLLSRLVIADSYRSESEPLEAFFKKSYADQIKEIGTKMAKKNDVWARALILAIEEKAHRESRHDVLRYLADVRPYFDAPSASKKMILEHLVLLF